MRMRHSSIGLLLECYCCRCTRWFWRWNSSMQGVYTPSRGLKFQNFCPRGKKHGEAQWHRDHLKAMDAREHGNSIRAPLKSGGKRMKSIEILGNIADTWTTSRRSTSQAPHPGTTGTGTRAPSHWYAKTMMIVKLDRSEQGRVFEPTTKILTSLRQQQGRQHYSIPKNERMWPKNIR